MNKKDILRFERKFIKIPNGCWLWIGSRNPRGYGNFYYKNKFISAHRFSWIFHFNNIPKNMSVLHRCDNPSCVNPIHLFIGTQLDNVIDMKNKGRLIPPKSPKGEKNQNAKISDSDVLKIIKDTRIQSEIAKDYGISQSHVSDIKRHKRRSIS